MDPFEKSSESHGALLFLKQPTNRICPYTILYLIMGGLAGQPPVENSQLQRRPVCAEFQTEGKVFIQNGNQNQSKKTESKFKKPRIMCKSEILTNSLKMR